MKHWMTTMAIGAAMTGTAFAHDTWMVPVTPTASAGAALMLHMTSGMAFPKVESALEPSRVARAGWRCARRSGPIDIFERGDSILVMEGPKLPDGVTVAWATLSPKGIDLDAKEVEQYFDEIGAPESLRRAWERDSAARKFHETYTKHMKTFMRAGDTRGDRTCLEPVGLMIEFLPDRDPTLLSEGDTLSVKVVKKGNELESFAVGVVCGADGSSALLRTNKAGYVRFPITRGGWWLVRGTELRRNADGTWESDFTTMTFHTGGKP